MIKGITVRLITRRLAGHNALNEPIFVPEEHTVDNVLVTPMSPEAVVTDMQLHGKHGVYELCIPKGDAHDWKDASVIFLGQRFRTYGEPIEYIDANVPLLWNRKVRVERFE